MTSTVTAYVTVTQLVTGPEPNGGAAQAHLPHPLYKPSIPTIPFPADFEALDTFNSERMTRSQTRARKRRHLL